MRRLWPADLLGRVGTGAAVPGRTEARQGHAPTGEHRKKPRSTAVWPAVGMFGALGCGACEREAPETASKRQAPLRSSMHAWARASLSIKYNCGLSALRA
eukprot:scaffold34103_cov253-Isochrysis_galbana.AAC.2